MAPHTPWSTLGGGQVQEPSFGPQDLCFPSRLSYNPPCDPGPISGPSVGPSLQEEHEGAGSHRLGQRTWKNLSCQPHPLFLGTQQAEGHPGPSLGKRAQLRSDTPYTSNQPCTRMRALGSKPPMPGAATPGPGSDSEPDTLAEALGTNDLTSSLAWWSRSWGLESGPECESQLCPFLCATSGKWPGGHFPHKRDLYAMDVSPGSQTELYGFYFLVVLFPN